VYSTQVGFVGAEIFTNFCFFIHNVGYRYARKSFKGSIDAEFGLVSEKILRQNNGSMGWGPGPGKGDQKNAKTPPLVAFPPENPKPKTKNVFFSISTRRLAESAEGLNSSLAQSPGELQDCKSLEKKWRMRD